jgi:hypothetical protein
MNPIPEMPSLCTSCSGYGQYTMDKWKFKFVIYMQKEAVTIFISLQCKILPVSSECTE